MPFVLPTGFYKAASAAAAAAYRTSTAGGGTAGTGNRTATIVPAVGDLLVVFCNAAGNATTTPTCSDDNSGTYTRINTAGHNFSANTMSWFVRDALMVNTTSTIVTVATGSNTAAEIVIVAVSGMTKTGATAVRSNGRQQNQTAGATPAPVLNQAALTTNITMAVVGNSSTAPIVTEPTGWIERQDAGQLTPSISLEVATRDSGFTGTTITFGSTSGTAWGSFALELDGT